MKTNLLKKVIACFLSVLMMVQVIPLNAFASEKENLKALEQSVSKKEIADVENELETERTEFSKTFLLKDGSYATYVSLEPIHMKDNKGNWKDINNIEKPLKVTDLQKELSQKNERIQTRSGGDRSNGSIVADDNGLLCETIGNELTGVDVNGGELRIQQYDNGAISQVYTAGYIKIPNIVLPNIGDGCIVTYATFSALCQDLNANVSGSTNIVTAQIVTGQWPTGNNYQHPIDTGVMDYNSIDLDGEEQYEWDITEAACGWTNKTLENNGIALTPHYNNCKISAYAYSMILYYKTIDELDDSFSYHSVDMGRAGMVYVNDFTRDMYLVRNELSVDGNIMPVSLTRTFNNSKNKDGASVGTGWHWNYISSLKKVNIQNERYYKWVKNNGSVIYFKEIDNSWIEYGTDCGYELTEEGQLAIIDSGDNKYKYGITSHKLESIVDDNENEILFNYNVDYGLSKVIDGVGRQYVISASNIINDYDENGHTNTYFYNGKYVYNLSLKDSLNGNVSFDGENNHDIQLRYLYNNNTYESLSKVTYIDGKFVEYS